MINLRPKTLDEMIGQDNIKACIKILLRAHQGDVLPHLLWDGPPGAGKTTFACAIANDAKQTIYLANGGGVQKIKDILPYLFKLKRGNILFIDEIHRMDVKVQEALFTAMEDFRIDIAKGMKSIALEEFTLIGATTEGGSLIQPFYDRFKHQFHLEPYTLAQIEEIISINARKLNVHSIDFHAVCNLAGRSRLTPRIANSLLEWCVDYAKSTGKAYITENVVNEAMLLKNIDKDGLDNNDRVYIDVLRRAGKPLGLNTIISATNLGRSTVEHRIEPFLLRLGIIEKQNRGRALL